MKIIKILQQLSRYGYLKYFNMIKSIVFYYNNKSSSVKLKILQQIQNCSFCSSFYEQHQDQ